MSDEKNLFLEMVKQLAESSEGQMSERLRKKCEDLLASKPTNGECYDLLLSISKEREISSFVKTLCEVDKYYERPQD